MADCYYAVVMAANKEISWEFIRETGGKKYILVKQTEKEYFVFRTPKHSAPASKHDYTLENWEGEIAPWGGIPVKVRNWLVRKRVKPDPENQAVLTPTT